MYLQPLTSDEIALRRGLSFPRHVDLLSAMLPFRRSRPQATRGSEASRRLSPSRRKQEPSPSLVDNPAVAAFDFLFQAG